MSGRAITPMVEMSALNGQRRLSVGCVIVHFERPELLRRTVAALAAQSRTPDITVVVDNGSRPHLRPALNAGPYQLLHLPVNDGYAAAANRGVEILRRAGLDAYFIITHETVLDESCLEVLVDSLEERAQTAAVGPLLGYLSCREKVFSAGGGFKRLSHRTYHLGHADPVKAWMGKAPRQVAWLDGAAILVRSEAWHQVDGMDEEYFLYCEELDFLQRLVVVGWKLECVPRALAWQEPGGNQSYLKSRNGLHFVAKRWGRGAAVLWSINEISRILARTALRRTDIPACRQTFAGLRAGIRGRMGRP